MILPGKKIYRLRYFILSLIIAVIVVISVWSPVIARFYVHSSKLNEDRIKILTVTPNDNTLNEVNRFSYGIQQTESPSKIVADASMIIDFGKYSVFPETGNDLSHFNKELLSEGLPRERLLYSSLIIPKVLLDAYLISNNEKFYRYAHDFIIDWANYEQSAWLPNGFLWDDHAIAARVLVLSKFWAILRQHNLFTTHDAAILIRSIERSAELLSKKSLFSVGTNHGVMQNIALLHIALVFPELKNSRSYISLAIQRLNEQISFYVNEDGVVQEHSAEYHEYGLQLLSMAFRYMELLGLSIPEEWSTKYNRAVNIYRNLLRPDGSLPMYGDTGSGIRKPIYLSNVDNVRYYRYITPLSIVKKRKSFTMLPRSGYSIWWDDNTGSCIQPDNSQTFIVWQNFISHAHKHADETSLLFWSNDQSWWTNVGYWPYGITHRDQAVSWPGSNAVHYIGEPELSSRATRLKAYYDGCDVKYLELERASDDGYRVNRQVLKYHDIWLVLDSVSDKKKRLSRSIWRTFPDVSVIHRGRGDYLLKRPDNETGLSVVISGSNGINMNLHRGDTMPFSGWLVDDDKVVKTDAFVLELLPEKWSALAWQPVSVIGKHGLRSVDMESWSSPHEWNIRITGSDHILSIARDESENKLEISYPGSSKSRRNINLKHTPVGDNLALDEQFTALRNKYEQPKLYYSYRIKVTWYLLAAFLAQESLFLFYIPRLSSRAQHFSRYVTITGWLVTAGWLYFFYFS